MRRVLLLAFLFLVAMAIVILNGQAEATPAQRAYQPFGAALEMFYGKQPEILLSGPAGTGKSRAILEKLHFCASKYPGMRGLITRKTRASLTESGLVTFESKVLPEGSPVKKGPSRRYRHSYEYPNGSELIVAGFDDAGRIMSTEFDMAAVLEATELAENDHESLTTRMRNFVMPYQQILADCNPGNPGHWLKGRADRGAVRMLNSTHEDNPTLFDRELRRWTPQGEAYLNTLGNLTGVRRLRLLKGIWAMAEGMCYADAWDPAFNLADRFEVPKEWRRLWVVDFGYTNPFCWQCWAIDPDGRMYRLAEIYRTKRLVEDHARDILAWQKLNDEPDPEAIVCDWDAEDRATLERHLGMSTIAAIKSVSDGLQVTAAQMRDAGDGKRRLVLLRDSLVGTHTHPHETRDALLYEKKKPGCTEEEIEGYVWNEKKDEPLKVDDHGMDAMRYAVMYVNDAPGLGVYV